MPNQSSSSRILLTGRFGLLGKYIYKELKSDCEIISLGLNTNNDICVDLSANVPQINSEIDILIHCAGSIEDANAMVTNFHGTKNLITAFNDSNKPKQLIYISSLSVYGKESGDEIDEDTPLRPTTEYGRSKMLAEQELQRWSSENNVILTILRPALTFGNGVHGKAKEMFEAICQGRYFHISGNTARRSVVMADDIANAVRLLHNKGGIYNITDGFHPTVIELADAMAANTSSVKRIMYCPLKWLKFAAKIGDKISPFGKFINSSKLNILTLSLTFSNRRLLEATGMSLYNTADVIARRSKDYPYEYTD